MGALTCVAIYCNTKNLSMASYMPLSPFLAFWDVNIGTDLECGASRATLATPSSRRRKPLICTVLHTVVATHQHLSGFDLLDTWTPWNRACIICGGQSID